MNATEVVHGAVALSATTIYYGGFAIFRCAARRMPELNGARPIRLAGLMLTDGTWLAGLVVLLAGAAAQVEALRLLPLGVAQPIFVASLAFLLVYAVAVLDERLTGREWASVLLFGFATLLIAISMAHQRQAPATAAKPFDLIVAVVPAAVVGFVVLMFGDVGGVGGGVGRHARPIAGVAYGIGAGACFGMSELAIKGMVTAYAAHPSVAAVAESPYPCIVVATAALALCQLQVALQRHRIAIVVSVLTVIAKTELVIVGSLAFGDPWPNESPLLACRIAAFALAIVAIMLFPRHEPRFAPALRPGEAR